MSKAKKIMKEAAIVVVKCMYVDHISYQDLIKYQGYIIRPICGYYYDGKRDPKIQEVIRRLFELRLRYKRENNPL